MQSQFTPTPAQNQHLQDYILPLVEKAARCLWRPADGEKEEWIADVRGVAIDNYYHCLQFDKPFSATSLARIAMGRVRDGRRLQSAPGSSIESVNARRHGVYVFTDHPRVMRWREQVGQLRDFGQASRRPAPPPDNAIVRVDFPAWVAKRKSRALRRALRVMIRLIGESGVAVAGALGVTPARVCQLRAQLVADWRRFTS